VSPRSVHEDLLEEGVRTAPEPETAEEKSRHLGLKTSGGAIVSGTAVAAKAGVLGKGLLWFFAFRGVVDSWRIGVWVGVAVTLVVVTALVIRSMREERS
jgi:hypothetical protein